MVAITMRFALAALALGAACVDSGAGEDTVGTRPKGLESSLKGPYTYKAYEPGDSVKYYHKESFPNMTDPNAGLAPYMEKVVMTHTLPLIIFGVIVLTLFVVWSAGMMECCAKKDCCCAKCCADPPAVFASKLGRLILIVLGLVLLLCIFSISVAGLENEKKQDESISDLGSILSVLTDWTNYTTEQLGYCDKQIDRVEVASTNLTDWNWSDAEIRKEVVKYGTLLTGAMAETGKQIAAINETAQSTSKDLTKIKDDLSKSINDFNDTRGYLVTTAYSVVVVLIFLSLLASILKIAFPENCAKKLRCCFGTFNFFYFWILVITFVVVVVLYIFSVVVADFCIESDNNFVSALGMKHNDTFTYYITCDTDAQLVNPFKADCQTVETQMGNAGEQLTNLDTVIADINAKIDQSKALKDSGPQDNPAIEARLQALYQDLAALTYQASTLKISVSALNISIGQDLTDMGFQSGLLSSLHCYQLNLRYQAVIWQVCDTVYNPLAQSMEYCLVIFILLIVVDWIRRWLRPTREAKGLTQIHHKARVQPVDIQPDYQNHDAGSRGSKRNSDAV